MIGVAVASQKVSIIVEGQEPQELPYNQTALKVVLDASRPDDRVLIVGNWQWAQALAYGLERNRRRVFYLSGPKQERGAKQPQVKLLASALANNIYGRPFFRKPAPEQPAPHPWVEQAHEYFRLIDEVRRAKHRILNCLRVLFPELISLENKLWQKQSVEALHQRDWSYFSGLDLDYSQSLSQYVPDADKMAKQKELAVLLSELEGLLVKQEAFKEAVQGVNHPISEFFNNTFSASLLVRLLCWRQWGSSRKNGFRHLRQYAGLAVSRIDSNGKARISRIRPEIRTVLFWLLRTNKAKEIIEEAMARRGLQKMPLPERMECLLLKVWQSCLKESVLTST